MNTFSKMWGIRTPQEAKDIIEKQKAEYDIDEPKNLEEQALSLAGKDVYEKLVKGYTEKQWEETVQNFRHSSSRDCRCALLMTTTTLTTVSRVSQWAVIHRSLRRCWMALMSLPERISLIEKSGKLSDGTEVSYDRILFTGQIDEYFDSKFGPLEYRSVRFETEKLDMENYQGNAVVNYTEREVPYTRIIEHKHFEFGKQPTTIISREYSSEWKPGVEPYYPVNNEKNNALYEKYAELAAKEGNVIFWRTFGTVQVLRYGQGAHGSAGCVKEEF